MDQVKIGAFLKELRKEKNLTQEQLAEQFSVTGRSVSRWENGKNMPDLGILVELSEFYGVDISEIIDGERRERIPEEEMKDTLTKVAEYSEADKENLKRTVRIFDLIGLGGLILNILVQGFNELHQYPVLDFVSGLGLGIALVAMILVLTYEDSGFLCGVKKKIFPNRNGLGNKAEETPEMQEK